MKKITLLFVLFLFIFAGILNSQTLINGRKSDSKPIPVLKEKTKTTEYKQLFKSDYDDPDNSKHLIAEDLYVTGSIGLGTDIIDGESFGFNTILMRENNLRIMFEDNSASASFPDNDWIIEINSNVNGGDNYFAIQDFSALTYPFRIMAGAIDNSLYVGETGNVGIGTASPGLKLHALRGDTPGLRLEQDGSSGWSPQTWDLAGNESNFFIRDVTNGSTYPFKVRPGAPTDALVVHSDGFVGIGIGYPTEHLHVEGNIKTNGFLSLVPLLTAPETPSEGDIYMDGNDHEIKIYTGTAWVTPTDNQDLEDASLTGTVLEIEIENGNSVSVDLYSLIEDLEARITALEEQVGDKDIQFTHARLFQNNPNPYKNQTNISYYIPHEINEAFLQISSIKGKLVKEMLIFERGKGSILIDESHTKSGTYFYTLVLDGKKLESKIMIKID
jgi:hypothetical protein